jgi:hypothetical protein
MEALEGEIVCPAIYEHCRCRLKRCHEGPHECGPRDLPYMGGGCYGKWTGSDGTNQPPNPVMLPNGFEVPQR